MAPEDGGLEETKTLLAWLFGWTPQVIDEIPLRDYPAWRVRAHKALEWALKTRGGGLG